MTRRSGIRDDFAKAVHEYLLIERTDLIPADFALIFGNRNIIGPLADEAAALYHTNHVPLIVASGGVETKNRITEAEALRQALMRRGVPDSVILQEQRSTNTGENVVYTRALLERDLEKRPSSVIGIGHIVAARRFMMTLQRHWPEIHKMHVSANPFAVKAGDWHTHRIFRRHAMAEWSKIEPYLGRDLIREIDIQELNRRTASLKTAREIRPEQNPP